ncbi:hypothetical protein BpHYR1_000070 [Brachionus plicatilis]|uniref:Uncharacterized protein n=1 Tax=Brachionus plicatilis TaxID=10195 RepID=A0A3M7SEN1_BRAPC|nr:hypothetical protein BpHYR1_000070 [Brachionus plicatilis]
MQHGKIRANIAQIAKIDLDGFQVFEFRNECVVQNFDSFGFLDVNFFNFGLRTPVAIELIFCQTVNHVDLSLETFPSWTVANK